MEEELTEEKYEVEEIRDAKVDGVNQKLMYLVKWKDYGEEENTWEYPHILTTAAAKVREFYKKNPGAPRPLPDMAKKLRLRPLTYDTEFELPLPNRLW